MDDEEVLSSTWVTLMDVAARVAKASTEAHPESWDKPDANNGIRRAIGAAVMVHGSPSHEWRVPSMLGNFVQLWSAGVIKPRHPDTYLEAPTEADIDFDWVITAGEAEETIRRLKLPSAASDKINQPRGAVIHSTKKRRNALDPVIELAQSKCSNPADVAEVWNALTALAAKKEHPLFGVTEDGIQWNNNGEVSFYSRKNLSDKLGRQRTKARYGAVKRGKARYGARGVTE